MPQNSSLLTIHLNAYLNVEKIFKVYDEDNIIISRSVDVMTNIDIPLNLPPRLNLRTFKTNINKIRLLNPDVIDIKLAMNTNSLKYITY